MLLYHADRMNSIKEGMTISLQKDFKLNCENQNVICEYFPEGLSYHGIQYAKDHKAYLIKDNPQIPFVWISKIGEANADLGMYLCEYQFELVRKAFFPHLPSRFQSMFGVAEIADFSQWKDIRINENTPIYEIYSDSEPFRFDSSWLKGGLCFGPSSAPSYLGFSLSINLNIAMSYWKGLPSPSPRWEYVIPLPAVVGRRVR